MRCTTWTTSNPPTVAATTTPSGTSTYDTTDRTRAVLPADPAPPPHPTHPPPAKPAGVRARPGPRPRLIDAGQFTRRVAPDTPFDWSTSMRPRPDRPPASPDPSTDPLTGQRRLARMFADQGQINPIED